MSHRQEIILQRLQPLSESTHCSSHQIHPLNSVTPPPFPVSTTLLASLLIPLITFNPSLPSPAFVLLCRQPIFFFLPYSSSYHPSSAASSFFLFFFLLSNHRPHLSLLLLHLPQLWMYMFSSRILEAPFLQYNCCVLSFASPL